MLLGTVFALGTLIRCYKAFCLALLEHPLLYGLPRLIGKALMLPSTFLDRDTSTQYC